MRINRISALALCASLAIGACAAPKLPSIICDSMVVQYDRPFVVWGAADPGETVPLVLNNQGKKKKLNTVADDSGRWQAQFPAIGAGRVCDLSVGDAQVKGIVGGEVFICSGQSNMELPVSRVTDMFAQEVASYSNPQIRQFHVPREISFAGPQDDMKPSKWVSVTPQQALNFSALAYFFAKQRYEDTGIPVGIINSCWGGTPVEAWTAADSLAQFPRVLDKYNAYRDDAFRANIKAVEGRNYAAWDGVLDLTDPGESGPVRWSAEKVDDSDWRLVDILSSDWGGSYQYPENGSHWFRRTVTLPDDFDGAEAILRLGCIVDADSAFVNGKKVGFTSYQYPPRIYNVPKGTLHPGENTVAVRVISQSGRPHFVPEKPYKLIVGDKEYDLSGQWRYHKGAPMPKGPSMQFYHYYPTVLFNQMIAPLKGLAFQGAIWYQGESNVGNNSYAEMLAAMMGNWRSYLGDDSMPFYVVELADFLHPSDVKGRKDWADMRRMQKRATELTHDAYLIQNSDLGEWNDIHPLDKKTPGQRIARAVLEHSKR
ncbi:MAG: hypothetical protein NC102_07940 [Clostridium sp.]|nr:hypothetical protein [Clostridium sp.]